jgi:hypothetical protein
MAKRTRITITVADESVAIHVQSDDQVTALKFEVCNCFRIDQDSFFLFQDLLIL